MNAIKKPLRILVIDPESEVVTVLIETLETDGHEVDLLTDLAPVLSQASRYRYDVALVAWVNAGTEGAKKVLSMMLAHFSEVPLVLAVDAAEVREAAEALNRGVFGYVLRPYLVGELRTMLNRVQQATISAVAEREHEHVYQILEQVQQLHGHLEPKRALNWLMASAIEAVGAAAGAILLLEPERGELVFEVVTGERCEGVKGLRVPVGKGICGWVAAHDTPQLILNAQDDPRFHPEIDLFTGLKTISLLAVPLHKAGQVVGVIEVINASKGYFSEGDKLLLSLVTSQASLAFEKAELLVSSQGQVRELTCLYEVSTRLNTTYQAPEILQLIVDNLTKTLGPDCSASINVYNRQAQKILVRAAAGVRPFENLLLPPRPDGLGARARYEKKLVLVNHALANPMIHPTGQHDQVQAAFAVPLLEGERALGALYVDTIAPRRFGQAEVQTAQFFANQTVIALRNARYVQQLLALTDIAEQLATKRELRPLLNGICQQAVELLDSDSANILLIVEEEGKSLLRIWGHYGVGERCVKETREELGEGIAGRVAARGKSLIDNNIPQNGLLLNPAAAEENFQSIASVPIFRDHEVIGTLDIHSKTHIDAFTDDDLHILTLMARQVAIAIYNTELLERFARVVESAPEGIIGIDAKGNVIEFNEEAERLIGYSANEAKQMHITKLYADGVQEARQIKHALRTQPNGRLRGYETCLRDSNGELLPIRLAAVQHTTTTGQDQGSFGYFHDLREFQAVDEFAQSLLGLPEEQELWQRIVDTLARTLNAEVSILLRYDNRTNSLKAQASYGLPNEIDLEYALDEGVVGQVFSKNQALRTKAGESDDEAIKVECVRLGQYSKFSAIHNCLTVPLAYQNEPLGVLLLLNKQKNNTLIETGFMQADESLLTTLAGQIVGLLQRAKHRAGLEALINVGTEIVATLDESKVLQKIVDALVATFGFRVVYFRLVDLDGSLVIRANAGTDGNYNHNPEYTLTAGQGITSEALQDRKAIWIEDVQASARFALPKMAECNGLRGMLAIPLIFEEQPIGTLTCYTGRPHRFTDDEVNLVSAFANLAAVALTNARQISKLHKLEQAGKALASLMHLNHVRKAIVENVLQVVEAEGAFVCLYDSVAERFDLERAVGVGLGEEVIVWSSKLRNKKAPRVNGIVDTIMRQNVLFVKDVLAPAQQERIGKLTQGQLGTAGIQAFIGIRLQVGEELVGALFLNYSHPYTPLSTDNEKATLKIYADQAALAVMRARLFERQEQKQQLLQSVASVISSMQDVEATWNEILNGAMNLTGAERGNISLVNEVQGVVKAVFQKGLSPETLARQHKIGGRSIQGWVAHHKKSALIANVQTQEPWNKIYYPGTPNTLSELTVPIMRGNSTQFVGIINLESPRERAFTDDDLRLLESLAVHADIAIQNAKLYADVRSRAKQLQDVLNAGQSIAALRPIRDVLKAITDSLVANFDYNSVILFPYDPKLELFEQPVISGHLDFPEVVLRTVNRNNLVKKLLNGPEYYFTSNISFDGLLSGTFTKREGIKDSGYVRLTTGNEVVGILFVNHSQPHTFTEDEQRAVRLFANQAAIAIRNTRQYEALQKQLERVERRGQHLAALYEAAKAITASLERSNTLQAILEAAVRLTGAYIATIQEKRGESLYFEAIYPPEKEKEVAQFIGKTMPLNGPGITVKAANTRLPCLINDVLQEPTLFVDINSNQTRAELAVPLLENGQVRGVLNVEHSESEAFDKDDVEVLTGLASLAVVALQNAEQYEELEMLRDHLLTSEAVAWLGLLGAEWKHAINQKMFSIASYVDGLHRSLKNKPRPLLSEEILDTLGRIKRIAQKVRGDNMINEAYSKLIIPKGKTMIDHELQDMVEKRCSSRADVKRVFNLNCPDIAIKIEPQWLRIAMEKLVDNALKAMQTGGTLTIATESVDDQVHITIKDTGGGIPESLQPYFLKRVIRERKEESGTGVGAIISRFIAINHHGELILVKSLPHEGTELCLKLPIA